MDNYAYRQLTAWQKAMSLVKMAYAMIRRFPQEERYALADQFRRAVLSIPANIAEGNGRASNRDYAHFLSIARGSLYETMTHYEIAMSMDYVGAQPEFEATAVEVRRMLTALIRKYGDLETE